MPAGRRRARAAPQLCALTHITDGVPALMGLFYAWQPKGLWHDAPASNLLDGGAPFYRCYRCADGRDVAVGCLEPQFFAQMVAGLGLGERGYDQQDRAGWPAMAEDFAAAFAAEPRDHWAALFAETDACVTPVLSMAEAPHHPHNLARRSFVARGGIAQPAPAPRLDRTPAGITEPAETTVTQAIARWTR